MSVHVIFDEDARDDLKRMDQSEWAGFVKKAEKLADMGPRGHLKHRIDAYTENVDRGGRMPYQWDEDDETLRILRCFTDHKEYEKWYKSYKK